VEYKPNRSGNWGDNYGNRCDRFLAAVAYLDGVRPSVVPCRGYYTRTTLWALDWRDGKLTERWFFDSDKGYTKYAGQGNHSLTVGDVDQTEKMRSFMVHAVSMITVRGYGPAVRGTAMQVIYAISIRIDRVWSIGLFMKIKVEMLEGLDTLFLMLKPESSYGVELKNRMLAEGFCGSDCSSCRDGMLGWDSRSSKL
jgi:hypothetical protein